LLPRTRAVSRARRLAACRTARFATANASPRLAWYVQ
jgi:hypothetical protein